MDEKKLRKIQKDIAKLRATPGNIRSSDLVNLAKRLGRKRRKQRTGEPAFVSDLLLYTTPIRIPIHPGTVKPRTAGAILDELEKDAFALEDLLN